jgi:predicted DsbA family dithiol-disulfide isomerase
MTSKADGRLRFEFWSDPLCIWAYCAQPRLKDVLSRWAGQLEVDHRIVPLAGSIIQRFRDGVWSARGPAGAQHETAHVARQHGLLDITGEVWVQDPPSSSWPAGCAAKAAMLLESRGALAPGTAERYLWGLRERFFLGNLNIARRRVQLEVAESTGVPVDALCGLLDDGTAFAALHEDDELRKGRGVRGSPTYVFDDGRAILYGNFPAALLGDTVKELLAGRCPGGSSCG